MDTSYDRTLPFQTALYYLEELHGMTMNETSFLDAGMIAWKRIGNRQVCKHLIQKEKTDENGCIDLPCNLLDIIYVVEHSGDFLDSPYRPDYTVARYDNTYPERILNRFSTKAAYQHSSEPSGQYIPYEVTETGIMIQSNGPDVEYDILYEGLVGDDEGFPKLNQREAEAISYFLAYITVHKRMGMKIEKDGNLVQYYYQLWSKACRNARVPEKFSQNFIDSVLNVKTSMNRKTYNRSLRMMKDV